MKLNKIHHVAIICSDYKKSKHFYTKVLGLEIIEETYREKRDSYKLDLRIGERDCIELFSFPNAPKRLSSPEACGLRHLAFEVDNVNAYKKYLESVGVAVEDVRVDAITNKKFAFFQDPDGLPLEIYQR